MIVTSTRTAGVDCCYCESGEDHEHITSQDVELALEVARRMLSPQFARQVGAQYIREHVDEQRMARALIALSADRDEWKGRAERHGCDVERGDPDCG